MTATPVRVDSAYKLADSEYRNIIVMLVQNSLLSLKCVRVSFVDQVDQFEMESLKTPIL